MKFRKREIVTRFARVWGTMRTAPAAGTATIFDPAADPSDAEIFDRFEGIGDGCEFAAVQQLAGVDRLALFKWAGVDLSILPGLLDRDLAGVDDPATFSLRLEERPSGKPEYMIDHYLLQCTMHAAKSISDLDPEEAKAREARRLTLMKRKFRADARAASRIYLYASLKPRPPEQVDALFDALGRQGPNRLLFVREADAAFPAGEVRLRRPGLAEAAIDALALYESGTTIRSAMWPGLVRTAHGVLAPGEPMP